MLLVGPFAGVLINGLDPFHARNIIVGAFTVQGIGYMVSLMIYSAYIYRLMTQKLPADTMRPGMFVSVGPSAFTCSGMVAMAAGSLKVLPSDFMGDGELTSTIIKVVAYWAGLWLWG